MSILRMAFLTCAMSVSPMVVSAEGETTDQGPSLMEEGLSLFLEGLQQQMEPTLDDFLTWMTEAGPELRSFVEEMGPALRDLMDDVEDWSTYHPPEMLPNGDIILRRKSPAVPAPPEDGDTEI